MENSRLAEPSSVYLIRDHAVVYELAPNSLITVGRLETSDIVLDDYKVSREHAVLKCSGDEFTLIDLASTHGTFVNGEGVEKLVIKIGSKIQIVNHELVLTDKIPADLRSTHILPTPKTARSMDRRLKFFGGLNEFPLLTFVQFLSQEKQSGLLLLEMGSVPGPRLWFRDGEIIHVSDGDGLAELLTRHHHDESLFFYFHHETSFPERTILQSTPSYLLEMCQQKDRESLEQLSTEASEARQARTRAVTIRMPSIS